MSIFRHRVNLDQTSWSFGNVPRKPFTSPDVYDLPQVGEWLPATVPGNVRVDLLANERIPDPFFGEQFKESLWVEDVDWWYRCRIEAAPLAPDQRAFLVFEGIDYLSAIFVNGHERARHEGMFSRQIIEVTDELQAGSAMVAVRLWGSSALPRRKLTVGQRLWQRFAGPIQGGWVGIYPDRSATLKCQMSFGWDFAPSIRTMGIWDEVSLVICRKVFIEAASVTGQPLLAQASSSTHAPANLTVHLKTNANQPQTVRVTVQIEAANFTEPAREPVHFSLDLPAGVSDHQLELHQDQVALWQPWDRGQPHLYRLNLSLVEAVTNAPLDSTSLQTGIRHLEWDGWRLAVNGQPEFCRGLNWVPADSFPGRLRAADYTRLLELARQSEANLLRVWGGGLREKRAFYETCDALGLLVWQEFPFACLFLGSYPRHDAFLRLVADEGGAIVRQISHHPSLVLWCGGNEFSRLRNRPLLQTLAQVVADHDGSRPFRAVSPSHDHGGDAHNWRVWHGEAAIRVYQSEQANFLSEFGLQALPHLDTLSAMLPDPTQNWETHHGHRRKLGRYLSIFVEPSAIEDDQFPITNNQLPALITRSQQAQAIGLQSAIEHMRRRKGEAGGVCVWQFNEPWPAISWAIVDYFGRPKLAYKRLRHWYNPVLISISFPAGEQWQAGDTFSADLWAINDSPADYLACRLQICVDKTVIDQRQVDLPANSGRCLGRLSYTFSTAPVNLSLTLHRDQALISQNSYDLDWADQRPTSLFLKFRRWVSRWVLW